MFRNAVFTLLIAIILSIPHGNAQNKNLELAEIGKVENGNFYAEIPFSYIDGSIFIDVTRNGITYNFLFDTGSDFTLLDKSILEEFDYRAFSKSNIIGPHVKNQMVETIIISEIHIAGILFSEIGGAIMDLDFTNEMFCKNLHGVIGINLMKKAKWQIDYKNQIIRLSNDISKFNLEDPQYVMETEVPSKGFGPESIDVTINGITMPFIIDTGNGSSKIVANPNSYKKVIQNSNAAEYGFPQSDKDYYLISENLLIGGVEFSNQIVSFENKVGNHRLLGNLFFENFVVTVDWENHQLYLAPYGEIEQDKLPDFPLKFEANYNANQVFVATGLSDFLKANKIKMGYVVSKVNGVDISNLSDKEFCEFWNSQWKDIMREGINEITIIKDERTKHSP